MRDVFLLLDAIHLAFNHPEYIPKDGITYCNAYVNEVCESYGYKGFLGMLANDMIDLMSKDPAWTPVAMEKCQAMANEGVLLVAGVKQNPHGHVVVLCPGKEKTSGRWGRVPSCANVGIENFIGKGINWSFSTFPICFAWRPSL